MSEVTEEVTVEPELSRSEKAAATRAANKAKKEVVEEVVAEDVVTSKPPKPRERLEIKDLPRDKSLAFGKLKKELIASANYTRTYPLKREALVAVLEATLKVIK